MTRFSIIVAVYNDERHLPSCLDSALAQTFDDFEVICVNDGSSDSTGAILAKRAETEQRLRIVTRENGGPSAARNTGMQAAQGDLLIFLDSDDELEPHALERIDAALQSQPADAVVFGWSYFPAESADRFVREHACVRDAFYPRFSPDLVFKEMSNPYLRLAVRRDAWAESGVLFDEELRVGEDAAFLFALYPRIGAVNLVSDQLYRYRLPHEGSIMDEIGRDVGSLCVADLSAAISIFGDWKRAGLLPLYGAQLVKWFVRNQLYTILRQPPELREPLVDLSRRMLRANFTMREIGSLEIDEPTWHLVRIVLAARDNGELLVEEKELNRALVQWRIAEYGMADLAATAIVRTAGMLRGGKLRQVMSSAIANDTGEDDEEGDCAACPHAPLVSVIVPVYNVEPFLDQALASIEAQTLRNIEIICVNDGSTDGSPDILRAHAENDSRIRVIDKPNAGYGSACNRGIAEARGEWIAIVEPDDWVEPAMYETMTDFASSFSSDLDIVKTPYWRIWMPDTDRQRRVNCSYRRRIRPKKQPFKLGEPGTLHLLGHHPSIWSALYRRAFLADRNIRFLEIPGAGWADNPFLAETLCQANAIAYLDQPFYNYREETPEKTERFARDNWKISLDRWHDMLDVYERLDVTDEGILRAHVRRGFTYIGLVLEYHDLASEDSVCNCVRSVFDRMEDGLVYADPSISPGAKQLYAELKGVPAPHANAVPYALHVVKEGLYNVANTGPAMTLDTFRSFVGSHAKREGKKAGETRVQAEETADSDTGESAG